jgi:hypothetical protein
MAREKKVFGVGLLGGIGHVNTPVTTFERLGGKGLSARGLALRSQPLVADGAVYRPNIRN